MFLVSNINYPLPKIVRNDFENKKLTCLTRSQSINLQVDEGNFDLTNLEIFSKTSSRKYITGVIMCIV